MAITNPVLLSALPGWGVGGGGGGGGYSRFQVTGIINGFVWVCNFWFQDFLGQDWDVFFGRIEFTKDFFGYSNNLNIRSSATVSWKLRFRNLAWNFLRVNFGQGIFLGFNFSPHSIIPISWKLEYTPGSELELVSLEKNGLKTYLLLSKMAVGGNL